MEMPCFNTTIGRSPPCAVLRATSTVAYWSHMLLRQSTLAHWSHMLLRLCMCLYRIFVRAKLSLMLYPIAVGVTFITVNMVYYIYPFAFVRTAWWAAMTGLCGLQAMLILWSEGPTVRSGRLTSSRPRERLNLVPGAAFSHQIPGLWTLAFPPYRSLQPLHEQVREDDRRVVSAPHMYPHTPFG